MTLVNHECRYMTNPEGAKLWGSYEKEQRSSSCSCRFDDSLAQDGEKSWHFKRKCPDCEEVWGALRCPHDENQPSCPHCGLQLKPSKVGLFERDWIAARKGILTAMKKRYRDGGYVRQLRIFLWSIGIGSKMTRAQRKRINEMLRHTGKTDTTIVNYGPYRVVAETPFGTLKNDCDGSPESVKTGKFGGS